MMKTHVSDKLRNIVKIFLDGQQRQLASENVAMRRDAELSHSLCTLRCASVATGVMWFVSKYNLNFDRLFLLIPKTFIRYLKDILHHHRIETISGTYALPRAADVSDLH
jgi:hypothetical protein